MTLIMVFLYVCGAPVAPWMFLLALMFDLLQD